MESTDKISMARFIQMIKASEAYLESRGNRFHRFLCLIVERLKNQHSAGGFALKCESAVLEVDDGEIERHRLMCEFLENIVLNSDYLLPREFALLVVQEFELLVSPRSFPASTVLRIRIYKLG